MTNLRVFSFKDDRALDQILDRVLLEHGTDFRDRSDLLRKSCHFLLETLGYKLSSEQANNAVYAQTPKSEGGARLEGHLR
jgi:hypothetical protein